MFIFVLPVCPSLCYNLYFCLLSLSLEIRPLFCASLFISLLFVLHFVKSGLIPFNSFRNFFRNPSLVLFVLAIYQYPLPRHFPLLSLLFRQNGWIKMKLTQRLLSAASLPFSLRPDPLLSAVSLQLIPSRFISPSFSL